MASTLNVNVAVCNQSALTVQLRVQFCILSFAVIVDGALLVNFASKCLNKSDVAVDATFVVFVHASFVFVQTAKVLLQIEQVVLQRAVVSLPIPQVGSLLHQLRNQAFFLCRGSSARSGG